MRARAQHNPEPPAPEIPLVQPAPREPWPAEIPQWQEPGDEPGHEPPAPPRAPPEVEPPPPRV